MIDLNYLLYDKSFDYKNNEKKESLFETIIRFNAMLESIEKENKVLFYTDTIWNIQIQKDISFFDWLFDENDTDEKKIIRSFIKELETVTKEFYDEAISLLSKAKQCSYNAFICFFYCDGFFQIEQKINNTRKEFLTNSKTSYRDNLYNNLIREEKEFNNAKKFYLHCSNSIKTFLENANHCLENLHFGLDVEKNMKSAYNDNQFIKNHIDIVIYQCKVLNEYGLAIVNKYRKQGEQKICEIIKSTGHSQGIFDDCSPEGDSKAALRLNLPFKNNPMNPVEIEIIIRCSPHIKYYFSNKHYRTYFGLPINSIANGKKIPVGSIGKHL